MFSLKDILSEKEAQGCPILKRVCASPFNGGTGNKGSNIPSSITCWLPPSTAQRRNTQTTILTWKKYFSSFLTQTYLTYFCQSLERILLLHSLCWGHYTTDQEIWRKAELTAHHHSHILFQIKQGTCLVYCSRSHPAITASIWHSVEFTQEKNLCIFQGVKALNSHASVKDHSAQPTRQGDGWHSLLC